LRESVIFRFVWMIIEGWFDVEDEQVYGCFTISYLFFGGYANLGTETALLCPGKVFGSDLPSSLFVFSQAFNFPILIFSCTNG